MKSPTEVDVVGFIYQVREVDVVNKIIPRNREIDFQRQIITTDKELSDDGKKTVLLHEITYTETEALGLDGICDDENAVQSLVVVLYYTLKYLNLTFS